MDVIDEPEELLTNSLLMNSPRGWSYFLPFGAVSEIVREEAMIPSISTSFAKRAPNQPT